DDPRVSDQRAGNQECRRCEKLLLCQLSLWRPLSATPPALKQIPIAGAPSMAEAVAAGRTAISSHGSNARRQYQAKAVSAASTRSTPAPIAREGTAPTAWIGVGNKGCGYSLRPS